jgi:anthranilate synthase component II
MRFDRRVRVLFLENNDSFSWNVIESLPVDRSHVLVRPGHQVSENRSAIKTADVVVVGPGPMDPVRANIVDAVLLAAAYRRPLLGICLGHQALGLAYGAKLERVHPAHGKQSGLVFSPSRLFPNLTGPVTVMRYHSLALRAVARPLRVIAQTSDGIAMAIEHRTLPMAGLQFHPDSYGTPRGQEMVAAFFKAVT